MGYNNNNIVIRLLILFIVFINLINANSDDISSPIKNNNNNKPSTTPLPFLLRKQFKYNVVLKNENKIKQDDIKSKESKDLKESKETTITTTTTTAPTPITTTESLTTTTTTTTNKNIDNQFNIINMVSKDGSKYKCLMPKPIKQIKDEWSEIPSIETIKKSLSSLKSKCIKSANPSHWWSYEFCYHDKVRQIHTEKGELLSEFILGNYNNNSPSNGAIKGVDQSTLDKYMKKEILEFPHSTSPTNNLPYFSEQYEDGTQCEILNIKRHTEVRYYCSEDSIQPTIQEIGEPSSCAYLFKVFTNKMCIHPLFQPKQDKALDIQCTKV